MAITNHLPHFVRLSQMAGCSISRSIKGNAAISLTLLYLNPYLACLIIGVTTFAFSWGGVLIGKRSGTWLESKAEVFGGVVLILIGIKMLVR